MLNAGTRAGLCCSHLLHLLALILGCGVGVHNTAQEGVVVASSAWPRLTPVSLAQSKQRSLQAAGGQWAFGTPTAATSPVEHNFPTMHAPQAGRWKEKMLEWMLKGCLFLYFFFFFLKVGILLLVFIFSMVFLLNKCSLFASSTALWAESRVSICLTEILW